MECKLGIKKFAKKWTLRWAKQKSWGRMGQNFTAVFPRKTPKFWNLFFHISKRLQHYPQSILSLFYVVKSLILGTALPRHREPNFKIRREMKLSTSILKIEKMNRNFISQQYLLKIKQSKHVYSLHRCWWRMMETKFVGDNKKMLMMVLAVFVTSIDYLFT